MTSHLDINLSIVLRICFGAFFVLTIREFFVWLRTRGIPERPPFFAPNSVSLDPTNPRPIRASSTKGFETLYVEGEHDLSMRMATVTDAFIPGAELWLRWSRVDSHVFQAVRHWTHIHIDGFADLLRVVDARDYALESAKFFDNLLGHIGESHVQADLMAAGNAVSLPFNSNFPGVDLWADGHPVNVKSGADAARAGYEHFSLHPEVPIVVPHDVAHIPSDAIHFDPTHALDTASLSGADHAVIVDDALSHADLANETRTAIDTLRDPGVHAHIAWVTCAISVFREGTLLLKGHTDLMRAMKNVVIDTGTVSSGASLGITMGAAVGKRVGGSIGMVTGGVVGGIAGTVGGRKLANSLKSRPLIAARKAYETAKSNYQTVENTAAHNANEKWIAAAKEEQERYDVLFSQLSEQYDKEVRSLRGKFSTISTVSGEEAKGLFLQLERILHKEVGAAKALAVNRLPRILRLFSFFLIGILAPEEYLVFRSTKRGVTEWKRCVRHLLRTWPSDTQPPEGLVDLVLAVPNGEDVATVFFRRVRTANAASDLREIGHRYGAQVLSARMDSVGRLRKSWQKVKMQVEQELTFALERLRLAIEDFRAEIRKAGGKVQSK